MGTKCMTMKSWPLSISNAVTEEKTTEAILNIKHQQKD